MNNTDICLCRYAVYKSVLLVVCPDNTATKNNHARGGACMLTYMHCMQSATPTNEGNHTMITTSTHTSLTAHSNKNLVPHADLFGPVR